MTESGLKKAQESLRRRRVSGEPVTVENNLIIKANDHESSKVKAIAAFCFHCHGGTAESMPDAGWKEAIRNCTAPDCPLYRHRAYR